ncbi:MAG: hypothetical protein E7241_09935 [Lachnospiraceae bacterium]|nr:hypothetical protein [Lachnospiraceae bacterium]
MTGKELKENIIASIDGAQWQQLKSGSLDVPVSEHNRKVLLELAESSEGFTGDVCSDDVEKLSGEVYKFLMEVWAEEPEAHKFVVLSCLALTFLKKIPMHPKEKVNYREVVGEDGEREFFCAHKTDSVICNFCVAKKDV